jgi:hypothetical protein
MKKIFLLLSLLFFSFAFSQEPSHAWMDRVIEREFSAFEKEGISKKLLETTWEQCKKKAEFRRYQILKGKVFGEEGRIKKLLCRMVEKYSVPDVDFIYYYEDRLKPSFFKRSRFQNAAPIFVSAKHRSLKRAILFSDWLYDIEEQTGGWNFLLRTINEGADRWPWEQKTGKLFWRGSPFDGNHFGKYTFENWKTFPRGAAVYASQLEPDAIDAAFSQYPSKFRSDLPRCEKEMGKCTFVPQIEQLQYKYHLLVDGVTATFPGTHWKLLSGSACFKQESDDILYFYPELIAWKHYIPVKNDLSDLLEKIAWAKEHDEQAKQIGEEGRKFALENLMPEDILLYCYKSLKKYASLQKFKP